MDVDRRYFNVNTGTAATNYANINLQPGYQRLTGEQALAFVRFRHTDDDYHRLARQQQFVRALKQQFAHNFNPLNLPSIVKTITSNVDVGGKARRPDCPELRALRVRGCRAATSSRTGSRESPATARRTRRHSAIQKAVDEFTHPDVEQPRRSPTRRRSAAS